MTISKISLYIYFLFLVGVGFLFISNDLYFLFTEFFVMLCIVNGLLFTTLGLIILQQELEK